MIFQPLETSQERVKMIVKSLYLFVFLLFICCTGIVAQTSSSRECRDAVGLLHSTNDADWDRRPHVLGPIVANNFALLLGIESVRGASGWDDAFSQSFLVNTGLDVTMTYITTRVQNERIPKWIPKFLKEMAAGKRGFFARASINTLVSTALTLFVWKSAAIPMGSEITGAEAAGALGLCAGFYFCMQAFAQTVFIEIPRKLDAKELGRLENLIGTGFSDLIQAADSHGGKWSLSKEEIRKRFLSAFEKAILKTNLEDQFFEIDKFEVPQNSVGWRLYDTATSARNATSESERQASRRKFIGHAIEYIGENPENSFSKKLTSILDLGAPFTPSQSLTIHAALQDRWGRTKWIVRVGTIFQPLMGGLAGGILLRGLTQWALNE